MKAAFAATSNVARFHAALGRLERRGAKESCILVVEGRPGLGKTLTLQRWAAEHDVVYVRAKKEWTPGWFLNDLLAELRIGAPAHSFEKRFAQAMEALLIRQSAKVRSKQTFAVVVDEADHISRNVRIMESIRDFSDLGYIPFVLIGMGKVKDNIIRLPQVFSRAPHHVRFEQASLQDVRLIVDALSEIPVGDCLVEFIHKVTEGYNREIVEAIAVIERFGKLNAGGKPVTLAMMAGQPLVMDRRLGEMVAVPEAL